MAAGSKRILIVDDSRTMRMKLREELEEGGYQVIEASNGLEALILAASPEPPDLITLDIEMPKMDGFETCRKLRSEYYSKFFRKDGASDLPVIFITSNDNMDDRRKGFELGAFDFVTKPFERGEILAIVNRILGESQTAREITALVADDSRMARKVATVCLTREGMQVIEAEDGAQALEIIKEMRDKIDIVLSDLMMPRLDGKSLCQKIRKELNMPDIPVILLTGVKDLSELLEVFKVGATDYLVKPFAKEELLARVMAHSERNRIQKELRKTIEQLKKANETIRQLSIIDPLTGCFNRGYLNSHLSREVSRSLRYRTPLSVILCDIDHFKRVNDNYGHQTGDKVLARFVELLQESIRQEIDWVARYGGEEFVIILPETGPSDARIIAERLRSTVEKTPLDLNGKAISITSSFGVGGFDPSSETEGITGDRLLHQADQNLYRAKEQGRNRVV